MLVNTKQKVAALASGLAIATTGMVVESPDAERAASHVAAHATPAADLAVSGASAGSSKPSSSQA
jgi:hypothetical protein